MARRVLVNIDDRIIDAVMDIGAREGIAGISAPKVAKMCGISHFTCFDHFGTKENMLKQAAIRLFFRWNFFVRYQVNVPDMRPAFRIMKLLMISGIHFAGRIATIQFSGEAR